MVDVLQRSLFKSKIGYVGLSKYFIQKIPREQVTSTRMQYQHNIYSFFASFSAEAPIEVTFSGGEYITYDLRQKGFEPILSTNDEISLHFKTRKSNGLLFYTGEFEPHL